MMSVAWNVADQTWSAAKDQDPDRWFHSLGWWGVAALALLVAAALVRAALRRDRYRAVDVLEPKDVEAVHDALRAAERRTVGEILPVVVERSDPHPGARWMAALVTLLLGSVLLAGVLPWERPAWLLVLQLALGALGWGAAHVLPDFARWFVSEGRATRVAAEQAFQEFYRHGLQHTEASTGVLLFVSLFERRVIVMGDAGIDAKVQQADWQRTDQAILEGVRAGDLRTGLVRGIEAAGELLAEHFPHAEGDRNEIPDRLIVRHE